MFPAATAAAPAERARMATCPACWAGPGAPCAADGLHLARYNRAERRGLISRAELAAAISGLTVITLGTVITGGAS